MVPRKPNMGAIPATMPSMPMFFSSLATSSLPIFSIAPSISLMGRPMRNKPFCNIRPNGELLLRQIAIADSKLPECMLLRTCCNKFDSFFEALRMVKYLSKNITKPNTANIPIGSITQPPFNIKSPKRRSWVGMAANCCAA